MASIIVPLLGHRVEIAAKDQRVLRVAAEALGAWCELPSEFVSAAAPARLQIDVKQGGTSAHVAANAAWRRTGSLVEARIASTRVQIDLTSRSAVAVTDESAIEDPDWFSWHVLAPARLLASLDDRIPLHAACVAAADRVALLVGPTGSGKSTTAYACHRMGLDVLAEDTVFVSVAHGLRFWALTDTFYLAPDADRWFPELARCPVGARPNGKVRRVVRRTTPPARFFVQAEPVVVLLDRVSPADCCSVGAAEWHSYLDRPFETGFDLYGAAWASVRPRLHDWQTYRLGTNGPPTAVAAAIARVLSRRL